MPVVGSADDDRVNVLAREHLPIVLGGEKIGSPLFFRALEPSGVHVASCNELDAIDAASHRGITGAHTTRADQSNLNLVVDHTCLNFSTACFRDPSCKCAFRSSSYWRAGQGQ